MSGVTIRAQSAYEGVRVALGTRHGKQRQLAPVLAKRLGARIVVPPDLDTDRFGTFSGERPRELPAADAARAKARLAMDALAAPFGLASEASYGPLPGVGWSGHEELLLFVDDTRGFEVVEGYRTLTLPGTPQVIRHPDEVQPERLGWPAQAVIVRPAARPGHAGLTKGVADAGTLRAAIDAAIAVAPDGRALVEPDLRAHHNPSRQRVLVALAGRLADRLRTPCPACGCPGFGRTDVERGLPCAQCGAPTEQVRADLLGCPRCDHRECRPRAERASEPRWCPECNP